MRPPAIEFVLTIDCEFPGAFTVAAAEAMAADALSARFPKLERETRENATFAVGEVVGLLFLTDDVRRGVRLTSHGWSLHQVGDVSDMNRWVDEMLAHWSACARATNPARVPSMSVAVRHEVALPFVAGRLDIDEYLKVAPRSPDEERMHVSAFRIENMYQDTETGMSISITLASVEPDEHFFRIEFVNGATDVEPLAGAAAEEIAARAKVLFALTDRTAGQVFTAKAEALWT